jgi:hypothetical protein
MPALSHIWNALRNLGLVRETPVAPGPVDDIVRLLKPEAPVSRQPLRDERLPPGKRRMRWSR